MKNVERSSGDLPACVARKVSKRADLGFEKRLLNLFLEPANPFAATARRPVYRAAGSLALLLACAAGLALYFQTVR